MQRCESIFERDWLRRAVAVLGCIAVLFFAVGGAALHHHTGGPDTACAICQTLHMPALAAARLELLPQSEQVTWHALLPKNVLPLDSFALHRASRAPPSA